MGEILKTENVSVRILNEELENYFENTIIPQLYVDADLILRKFTPPAMKQFSLSKADLGKNMNEVVDNIRYPTIIENIQEVIDSGVILEKEVQTTDKRWFQMNILPYTVRKRNKTDGVIITFVDITSRIITLKDLEKVNADHNTFIYAVTHDIKQPLSIISVVTELLTHAFSNNNRKQFAKSMEMLGRSVNTIKVIIDDLTLHSKTKTDISAEHERLNIENIFEDVILALKDSIYNKEVKIITGFKTSEIQFSRKNLRSIVYNLLSNAIKYKKPEAPLEILIKTKKLKNYILLTVHDNGPGIDKQHHKRIFKKAERINTTEEGTGMGLYIVKSMLENNGGKIEVKSNFEEGTTFKVYFKSEPD